MANFVSNDNATSLINAINSKKDTKPVEITYAEWIVLTDEERAGTHYLITDVPAQSGGGHVIENTSGTDMPQENNLQFVGVYTEDDNTNDRTKINIVRQMTKTEFNALSSAEKEGFIHITDEPDNPYNGESGGGGHTIVDPSGESMTQQPNMQFTDAHVTNDSTNSSTDIEILSSISEADFDDLDETDSANEGLYEVNSDDTALLTDDMIAHSATQTVRDAINELDEEISSLINGGLKMFAGTGSINVGPQTDNTSSITPEDIKAASGFTTIYHVLCNFRGNGGGTPALLWWGYDQRFHSYGVYSSGGSYNNIGFSYIAFGV